MDFGRLYSYAYQFRYVCIVSLLGRLFDRVDLIKPVSNVRPFVHPSTKRFFDFNEILRVCRGQ